jgi:hypothetical protein
VAPGFHVVTPEAELEYAPMIGPTLRGPQRLRVAS